jgi:predicted transcriptional regulator
MQIENVKEKAHQLLNNLPDSATWEDLMYRIYVREAIEAGLKDSDQGKTVDVTEVRKKFGLPA